MPKVTKLLNEFYRSANSKQYPIAIMNFIVPTKVYDVNVTPDKRKFFFSDEGSLLKSLKEALLEIYAPRLASFLVHGPEELTQGGNTSKLCSPHETLRSSPAVKPINLDDYSLSKTDFTLKFHGNIIQLNNAERNIFTSFCRCCPVAAYNIKHESISSNTLSEVPVLRTTKIDMEDLISRLNQEIAVKDYLTKKVNDLEEELETTKVTSNENLHQAILMERERVTQMQWDMEELRRKSLEMEFKLKSQSQQDENVEIEEKDELLKELEDTKSKLDQLSKKHQELEIKSKANVKILVKEVKSLRSSQAELKQQLNQSVIEKSEAEKLVQQEKERMEVGRMKLLHEVAPVTFTFFLLPICLVIS
ncbi:unnamed protein product [Lactuca saligna]|uniref:DNA mismatch repair protein S5 domain-containing protein n=1 Tax=Lactuca saligna TaxID=75948 RepID=A0AA35Z7C6_LACSI|nr:unnamed protein product [Lactuca saligna]